MVIADFMHQFYWKLSVGAHGQIMSRKGKIQRQSLKIVHRNAPAAYNHTISGMSLYAFAPFFSISFRFL
jgi:hypothetical protein